MPPAESLPPDPLQAYNELVQRRAELAGITEYANERVAALYQYTLSALDEQIAAAEVPLVEHVLGDAIEALTVYDQLTLLRGAVRNLAIEEQVEAEMAAAKGKIERAAHVLTKFEVADPPDPRVERVLAVAGLAGEAAVAKAAQVVDLVLETAEPPENVIPPESEEPAGRGPGDLPTMEEALERLRQYAVGHDVTTEQNPAGVFAIIAPGVRYHKKSQFLFMRRVMAQAPEEAGLVIQSNGLRGRAVRYTISNVQEGDPSGATTDPAASEATAKKFNIDTYLSTAEGLLLASFLCKFNEVLVGRGLPPISETVLTPLLEAVSVEAPVSRDLEELQDARMRAVANIGALFQNQALVDAAIETLDINDPRYPLFEYLFGMMDDSTYPQLLELLEANKGLVITMNLERTGGHHIHDVKARVELGAATVDVIPGGLPASEAADTEPTDGEPAKAVSQTGASEAEPLPSEAPQEKHPRQEKQPPGLKEAKKVIGTVLRQMQDAGFDMTRDYAVRSLIPYLGQGIGRDVGAARERSILSRGGSGNRNSLGGISVVDALLAKLCNSPKPVVMGYVSGHHNELRKLIEETIENISGE